MCSPQTHTASNELSCPRRGLPRGRTRSSFSCHDVHAYVCACVRACVQAHVRSSQCLHQWSRRQTDRGRKKNVVSSSHAQEIVQIHYNRILPSMNMSGMKPSSIAEVLIGSACDGRWLLVVRACIRNAHHHTRRPMIGYRARDKQTKSGSALLCSKRQGKMYAPAQLYPKTTWVE